MSIPLSIIIIVICVIGSFFFSASETALANVNRFKMQVKADEGKKSAKLIIKVIDKYDHALSTVLIGNNLVAIVISVVSTLLFLNIFKQSGLTNDTVSLISSIIMTFIVYVFGDTLPKTIAKAIPDTMSVIVIYPIYGLMILFYPLGILFTLLAKLIEKMFKVKNTDDDFTEEDFENAVEQVSDQGVIEKEQSEIIQSALEFDDTNVKEVLTPKEKMFAVDIHNLSIEEINKLILQTNYSRIPVYDRSFDNIIGILNVKTYFISYMDNPNLSVRRNLQKPYFVSSKIMIDDLFKGFKKNHTHIAIVRDQNKKVIGMVTMEDVLEEIVEDIDEPYLRKVRAK